MLKKINQCLVRFFRLLVLFFRRWRLHLVNFILIFLANFEINFIFFLVPLAHIIFFVLFLQFKNLLFLLFILFLLIFFIVFLRLNFNFVWFSFRPVCLRVFIYNINKDYKPTGSFMKSGLLLYPSQIRLHVSIHCLICFGFLS